MATTTEEFRLLMERVLTGSPEAAAELLRRFGPVVRHAVRQRLNQRMRTKFDSLDFVQDVWASFFANPPEQEALHDPQFLIAFLAKVARNKVVDATRQRMIGQKYNINREHSLDGSTPGGAAQLVGRQPTPSQVVTRREEWDRLVADQPLVYQRILLLLRDNKKPVEIAKELGIHRRMVSRFIDSLVTKYTP